MLQKLKQDLEPNVPVIKKSFIAGVVCTFLVHMYPMVNQITNHDGVVNLLGDNDTTKLGRWLLTYVTYATSKWAEMPWVIGVWSALFLGLSVAVVVNLLHIHSTPAVWACAALMTSFPTIACTFAYKFTAAVYFMALFLAALGVWLMVRQGLPGFILGILCLTACMGIYQAYISTAVGLLMLWAIQRLVRKPESWKKVLGKGLLSIVGVAVSGGLYYGILQIMLRVRHIKLDSYRGADQMGKYTLEEIPALLRTTWEQVIGFFFKPESTHYMGTATVAIQCVLLVLGLAAMIALLVRNKAYRYPAALVMLVLLILLLPFGINSIQLLNKSEAPHVLMIYAFVLVYLLMIALVERWNDVRKAEPKPRRSWLRVAALVMCAGLTYQFALLSNLGYLRLQISMVTTEQFSNRVVMRLEEQPSFGEAPVVFVGGFSDEIYPETNPRFERTDYLTGMSLDAVVFGEYQLRGYIQSYLHVKLPSPSKEQREQVMNSAELAEMPVWPAEGSVAEIDGVLVVKFTEDIEKYK